MSSIARAQIDCNLLHKTDFEEATEGLNRLRKPLSFMSASAELEFLVFNRPELKVGCSGSFISDKGEILTASHCVDDCVKEAKVAGTQGSPTCKVKLNGTWQDMELVISAKCTMNAVAGLYLKGKPTAEPCGSDAPSDYAVLRPLHPEKLKDFSCLNISSERPKLGEDVFTMGFPSATSRGGLWNKAKDAPGKKLVLSSGQTVDRPLCIASWEPKYSIQDWFWDRNPEILEVGAYKFAKTTGLIQTTVDLVGGSSGGPLINSKGEIAGVASVVDRSVQNLNQECRGATFFQPLTGFKDRIAGRVGACDKHKADVGESL